MIPEIDLEPDGVQEMLGMLNWEVVPLQEERYQFHHSSIVTGLQ
ncbi:hypothetical protein GBAR_LOCUS21654 [Geodia barretti]|uniref:Uncharacterized protein n=1 Tax=Geodia barretti TaxID=519541 RepID=A0AA35T0R5_GEOBA|nr:hypothetical protein GBAR_LOCUS21654 [Geodia barretti]